MLKKSGKTAALFAIAIVLMGGFLGAALGQVQGTEKVSFSFVVLGDGQFPATGVNVNLESANGAMLANGTSTPIVKFQAYPGNYIIFIPNQYVSGTVYNATEYSVSLLANGTEYSGNSVFSAANVGKISANYYTYVTVKGVSLSQVGSIYLTLPNGLSLPAARVNSSNPNSGYSVYTIPGKQILNVQYYSGSTAIYSESFIAASVSNNSVIANVSSSQNLLGTVSSSTGSYVNDVEVSIYQSGDLLTSDNFTNGYYYLSIPTGTYSLVISSPGYLPREISVTVTSGEKPLFQAISLTPSKTTQVQSISFSSDFQTITAKGGLTLANSTVLSFLPYSNAGSLYNQLKLDNLNKGQLWSILNYTVPSSSVYTVLYNNYSYNSSYHTTSLSSNVGNGVLYQFNYTATYYQSKVKAQNNSTIQLYVNQNTSGVSYISELSIPSGYQRANVVNASIADVSGYSGTIKVANSSFSGFMSIKIAQREKPTLNMNLLSASWNDSFESTISSNTSSNFTLLVPVGKNVTLNASNIPYDNVLQSDDYQSMNFTWNIGNAVAYGYNITKIFTSGSHSTSLKVVSAGGMANISNFTIIGDSQYPLLRLDIIQNGVVKENITTSSASSYTLWLNQTETVYFNSIRSQDLLPSGSSTGLPLVINWNISGSKETGTNVSYSFNTPTFNSSVLSASVSIKNGVGNSFNVSFTIHVNDTTPPVVAFKIYNTSSGSVVSSINEKQNVTLNASQSYAPNGGYIRFYNWSFTFTNGSVAQPNVDYKVYSSSSNNSTITMAFLQYGKYNIKLAESDQSNNTESNSMSLVINAVRPEVEITNVTYPKHYVEGSSSVLKINLTNIGLVTAVTYYVTVKVGLKVVKNETFTNLSSNQSYNASVTFVPPSSGSYSLVISVFAVNQPSFFNTNTSVTKAVSVAQAEWKLPALVGGIVVAIGVLSFIYYDVTVRRKRPKETKQPKKQLKV